jgi:hypothetical protein
MTNILENPKNILYIISKTALNVGKDHLQNLILANFSVLVTSAYMLNLEIEESPRDPVSPRK